MNREITKMICKWIWLMVPLAGCTYGDTDRYAGHSGKVYIALDWGEMATPDSACFYFYPAGQNRPLERKASGSGFEGVLESGVYQVMVTNTNYTNLSVRKDKGYDGAYAYADPAGTKAGEPTLIAHPLNLYGSGIAQLTVDGNTPVVSTTYPRPLVYPVQLDLLVEGTAAIEEVDGKLSGVSSAVHIPTGKADFTEPASISIPLEKRADGRFHSSATTFGLRPAAAGQAEQPNQLEMQIRMADGTEFTSGLDITELIDETVKESVITGTIAATIQLELVVDPTVPGGFQLQQVGWKTGTGSAGEENKGEEKI